MSNEIATTKARDDWDTDDGDDKRVIQGTLIKCVDGHWSTKEGGAPPKHLMALSTNTVIQCWQENKPIETIVEHPLPDVDELNAKIPEDDWEIGIGGEPRPPWQKQWIVYLLDPVTMAKFTFANGTAGAKIAVNNLRDQVKWMRAMRGNSVLPVIELSAVPMKTKFGTKQRPEFKILKFVQIGAGTGNVAVEAQVVPQIEHQAAAPASKSPRAFTALKAVKPPTTHEVLDDEIPFDAGRLA